MRDLLPCSTVSRCFAPFRKTFLYSVVFETLLFRGYFAMQEVSYLSSSMDIFFALTIIEIIRAMRNVSSTYIP